MIELKRWNRVGLFVLLVLSFATLLQSQDTARNDFSGRWEGLIPGPASIVQYLDLRADGTYHLLSSYILNGKRYSTGHSGKWTIVDVKRKLINLSGGPADNPQTADDRVNGESVDLNEWIRK
jgi:hypothetical protein